MTHFDITEAIRAAAHSLGLQKVGFASADRFRDAEDAFQRWLDAGYHGAMSYLAEQGQRSTPADLLADARSVIVVALSYGTTVPLRRKAEPMLAGAVAGYAQGPDYHHVLKAKLWKLSRALEPIVGRPVASRVCVDTAPLLEREAARRAGVGFIGKSAMCIVPGLGSTVLIGALVTDLELAVDPVVEQGCGRCTACIDVCPTGAFVGDRVVDARRCIAYLTIEHVGAIPRELRPALGTRVFGCDACQDVCPFNATPTRVGSPDLAPHAHLTAADLVHWLRLGAAGYRKLVRDSALRRTHRAQLARNAAVALGNLGDARGVAPLTDALRLDRHPLVRAHAAWALGRLGGAAARAALEQAARHDDDDAVREEARRALEDAG